MNITLSAEGKTIEKARSWARNHGTSLNAVIRDHLESLGQDNDLQSVADLFRKNALEGAGSSGSAHPFSRDEIYTGQRFRS